MKVMMLALPYFDGYEDEEEEGSSEAPNTVKISSPSVKTKNCCLKELTKFHSKKLPQRARLLEVLPL